VSYAIGVARPLSVAVETFGTGKVSDDASSELITDCFDLRPAAIIRDLDLRRPIYRATAAYGHFGRQRHRRAVGALDKVDAPLRPTSPYAVSKIAQDYLGLQYYLSHGVPAIRMRPFNHTGPRQRRGFVAPDFASQIADIEAGLRPPVMLVGQLDAERDFSDVRDIVRGYALAATKGAAGEVYNIGACEAHSVRELLDALLGYSTIEIEVRQDPERMRPVDTPVIVGDCSKLRAATGWEPRIPFKQTVGDVLDDWRNRVNTQRT
jgi:nucleoside-diphosphate-sugar epimerase